MTPDQKVQAYLSWFNENVKDQSNWSWMRSDKDCANWQPDEDGNFSGPPIPYSRGEILFMTSDPKAMRASLDIKIASNKNRYTEMGKYINGDPKQGTFNPEYAARFEAGKKLNEQLAQLSPKEATKVMDQIKSGEKDGFTHDDELFMATVRVHSKVVKNDFSEEEAVKDLTEEELRIWNKMRWFVNRASGGLLCKKVGDV